ncbi:unnamed protein product [Rhizophagus irregularis]|nr:unnamed protein product [Rhizophagus irregularis]
MVITTRKKYKQMLKEAEKVVAKERSSVQEIADESENDSNYLYKSEILLEKSFITIQEINNNTIFEASISDLNIIINDEVEVNKQTLLKKERKPPSKIFNLMMIFFQKAVLLLSTTLVVDWAGVKLSKSILVKGGYKYLIDQQLEYLINYQRFRKKFGDEGLRKLFKEVDLWLEEPSRLFRSYTIFYFAELFKEEKVITSDIQLEEETWISLQEAQVEVFPKYDI